MMTITGTDELSLKILDSFMDGAKLKDIPSMFPVSLDQAKRLSRYFNYLKQARAHLHTNEVEKLHNIGLKALYLSPLFKDKDWEGLAEILPTINENTKRDELPLLIEALREKRKRVAAFKQSAEQRLDTLESREKELIELDEETSQLMQKIEKENEFIKKYPKRVQKFLLKHLGLYEDQLVLARRLDSRWQKALKKKGVISYQSRKYIWLVHDVDALVEEYQSRTKRKNNTEWDLETEKKRGTDYYVGHDPRYRLPTGLAADLQSSLEEIEKKKQEIESERNEIQREIKRLRKTTPQSFIEAVEAANALSVHDLKKHGELQDKALKWLFNQGYIAASEITLPNGKRADVIGYNEQGYIVIIEVKASISDFMQDDKWQTYLEYCDEFYFLPVDEAKQAFYKRKECIQAGLLLETKNNVKVVEEHQLNHEAKERTAIHFAVSKALSRKYVYGY
jgi:hypothetical protein